MDNQHHHHQQLLRETILMGVQRLVVTASPAAGYKTPGVYVQEVPSGVQS